MTRTQIQLPDDLYQRAKAFAAQRELSLAEVTLPGLEQHRRTMWLGWNKRTAERRPEVAKMVKALAGKRLEVGKSADA